MIAALSQNTVLKNSVNLDSEEFSDDYLFNGYEYCRDNGINEALFKVRILKNIFECNNSEVYSFFVGVVLCGEIMQILKSKVSKIVISGRRQLKYAMSILLGKYSNAEIVCMSDEETDNSVTKGMLKIFEGEL